MKRPKWLELGGAEMAEIRELPAVKMIIEWLEWERAEAMDLVLVGAAGAGQHDPKLRAGTVLAYDTIIRSLYTPVAIADMSDDDFIDPARRPNRKDETDAEV